MPEHHVDSTRHPGQTEALWQENCALRRERDTWQTLAARLAEACEAALDPDPCSLDHHGYCQAHSLGDPCEQKLLREALAAYRQQKGA